MDPPHSRATYAGYYRGTGAPMVTPTGHGVHREGVVQGSKRAGAAPLPLGGWWCPGSPHASRRALLPGLWWGPGQVVDPGQRHSRDATIPGDRSPRRLGAPLGRLALWAEDGRRPRKAPARRGRPSRRPPPRPHPFALDADGIRLAVAELGVSSIGLAEGSGEMELMLRLPDAGGGPVGSPWLEDQPTDPWPEDATSHELPVWTVPGLAVEWTEALDDVSTLAALAGTPSDRRLLAHLTSRSPPTSGSPLGSWRWSWNWSLGGASCRRSKRRPTDGGPSGVRSSTVRIVVGSRRWCGRFPQRSLRRALRSGGPRSRSGGSGAGGAGRRPPLPHLGVHGCAGPAVRLQPATGRRAGGDRTTSAPVGRVADRAGVTRRDSGS